MHPSACHFVLGEKFMTQESYKSAKSKGKENKTT
jgi:hypothetical protein